MPKLLLLIICFYLSALTSAQQRDAYYNSHEYGEKEGVNSTNFSKLNLMSTGQLTAAVYNNGFYIVTNNQAKYILPENDHILQDAELYILGQDTFFLSHQNTSLHRYSSNNLIPVNGAPDKLKDIRLIPDHGIFYNALRNNHWRLEKFDGLHFSSFDMYNAGQLIIKKTGSNQYKAVSVDSNLISVFNINLQNLKLVPSDKYVLLNEQKTQPLSSVQFLNKDTMVLSFSNLLYLVTKKSNKRMLHKFSGIAGLKDGISYVDGLTSTGVLNISSKGTEEIKLNSSQPVMGFADDQYYNSAYLGTYNKLFRLFRHVKQYPYVFNNSNANAIQTIQQSKNGAVWVGSYNGSVSIIDNNNITPVKDWIGAVLPGGLSNYNNGVLLNSQGSTELKSDGLFYLTQDRKPQQITAQLPGYYLFSSPHSGSIYYGTGSSRGLWITDSSSLRAGKPQWRIIDSSHSLTLNNIVTITEDNVGRIWMGRSGQGIAIYYPGKNKVTTFLIDKKQIDFGAMSSLTDTYGTVWLGTKKGVRYYDAASTGEVTAEDILPLKHPLLSTDRTVSFLTQWENWLVIGASDKILLLDLTVWHNDKKICLRYLNEHETNFTSSTEQNAVLTDKRDSSIWFATSDMLYNWQIKQWLHLPVTSVMPTVNVTSKNNIRCLNNDKTIEVEPDQNSLRVDISYQSPDNLPRFIAVNLVKEGEALPIYEASIQTSFSYPNLSPGNYTLFVDVFQQDGSTTRYSYYIKLNKFLWQQWWFWTLIAVVIICIAVYLITVERKRQLAEEKSKRISAEAEALKSEQNRQLTRLQVTSLSNQFRPHFILNALNTIGAKLYDKPEVDAALGILGDSISIIFKNAQAGSIAHSISEEWKLVQSVIEIKQMELERKVVVNVIDEQKIFKSKSFVLPMGIIQIPVENAFTHGLRNKESGNLLLEIEATVTAEHLLITITDNGIGRKAAATISNYRSNGVATKNIVAILELLNRFNLHKLEYIIEDDVYKENAESYGTRVTIKIPQTFSYEVS